MALVKRECQIRYNGKFITPAYLDDDVQAKLIDAGYIDEKYIIYDDHQVVEKDEVSILREQLDALGVKYSHRAGAKKLKEKLKEAQGES